MSADQVAEISPAIREVLAGAPDLCATFEISGEADSWIQFSGGVVNAAYPHVVDPSELVAAIGNARVQEWESGKFLTVHIPNLDARNIAKWIDQYFEKVLHAKGNYSVDVRIESL